jgi:hypothetical protein
MLQIIQIQNKTNITLNNLEFTKQTQKKKNQNSVGDISATSGTEEQC